MEAYDAAISNPREHAMRNATELIVQYAAYHRDRRNITTHFVGVPMIVFGVGVLLARPAFDVAGLMLTPGWLLLLFGVAWYLTRGNLALGLATSVVAAVLFVAAHQLASAGTAMWLTVGLASFAVGWVVQFIGHFYEGCKPAFADDLAGLMVGPMFVVGEWLFAIGLCQSLADEIDRRAGPTHLRDLSPPLA